MEGFASLERASEVELFADAHARSRLALDFETRLPELDSSRVVAASQKEHAGDLETRASRASASLQVAAAAAAAEP